MPGDVHAVALELPGFGGTRMDPSLRSVRDFAARIADRAAAEAGPRVILGHGIGASMLLDLPAGAADGLILHAPVGPRLDRRLLPLAMRLPGARTALRRVIAAPGLRALWRRLAFPPPVPADYGDRFFAEYGRCEAFGLMFDIITPEWWAALAPRTEPAVVLWGARDRVLRAGHAADVAALVPGAARSVVDGWGHFPMIDRPEEYAAVVARLARGLLTTPAVAP
jgi:pimeloyl-ACP methyl ester carboxylesterase